MSSSSDNQFRHTATTATERKILWIALVLNATMFIIGLLSGFLAQSTSLIADSFDMLSDALAYTISLAVIGRSQRFKTVGAKFSGGLLLILGTSVLVEVLRRSLSNSAPEAITMIIIACMSLVVNAYVLHLLKRFRKGEVHMQASWIFTRADVIANLGVILSGLLVLVTNSRYPDLIVGFAIGLYVIKEALEILKIASKQS